MHADRNIACIAVLLHIETLGINKAGQCEYFRNMFEQPGAIVCFTVALNKHINFVNNSHGIYSQIILITSVHVIAMVNKTI